jgi:hypothetical protein
MNRPRSTSLTLLVVLSLCAAESARAASPDSTAQRVDTAAAHGAESDLEHYGNGIAHVLSSPIRWEGGEWIVAGGIVVGTLGSALLDDEVRSMMRRNQSSFNDALDNVGYNYGAPQYAASAALLVYLGGAIADDAWTRTTGLMLLETLTAIGIVQVPSRIVAGRARPFVGAGNASFDAFTGTQQPRASFISGHAAIAVGMSTVLARRIDHPIATAGLALLAATTPWVRLNTDAHWFSDTVIGMTLGYLIGTTVVERDESGGGLGLMVVPGGVGLTVVF